MDFSTWLKRWLTRHPLKEAPSQDQVRYTAEVMTRIKTLAPTPQVAPQRAWDPMVWGWPRLALSVATAAIGIALIIGIMDGSSRQLAEDISRESQVLIALEEPVNGFVNGDEVEALAAELELSDRLMLAESLPGDEAWLEQTLQLLDRLDEEVSDEASGETSEEELLEELEAIHDSDLAVRS